MAHGVDPRLGEYCDLINPKWLSDEEKVVMEAMLPELSRHRQLAKDNIKRAAEQYKQYYDQKFRVGQYKFGKGDVVWIKSTRPAGTAVGKTDEYHIGPYRIVDTVGDVLFRLQDSKTGAAVTSLMHGNNLTYLPDEDSSGLRRMKERHGDIPLPATKQKTIQVTSGAEGVQEIVRLQQPRDSGPPLAGKVAKVRGKPSVKSKSKAKK